MKKLLFLLLVAPMLQAATYYVSPTGNDSNPGSHGAPWLTPAKASSVAAAGDTVLFLDGTYTLPASGSQTGDWFITSSGTSGHPITFKSLNKWQAKIVGTGTVASGTVIGISGGYITIQDFDITGSNDNGINMTTNGASASFNTVQGNYIHDMTLPCSSSGGAAVTTGSGAGVYVGVDHESMMGNLVVNMLSAGGCGPTPHIPGGLDMMLPNGTVANNIVINAGDAIEAWHNSTAATFYGNVVINSNRGISVGCGDAGACAGGNDNSIVQNNIIINGADDAIIETGTTGNHNLYKDNLVFNGNTTISLHVGTPAATGTIVADPLFVNNTGTAAGNYRLQVTSPAKMTGLFLAGITTDFVGNARPSSGNSDIGAFGSGALWFVRADGGTRFSANVASGQCDGLADVAYPGSGTNQHCAFNDFRYLWDDDSGLVGLGAWVISGGDTVVVRGCHALASQQNPANPTCRIGWDINSGGGPSNNWCNGVGPYGCTNPAIPSGTAVAHTRILGGCMLAGNCNTGNVTNRSNLTQLFGGFGLQFTLNFRSTSYVDFEGIELTTHNGACSHHGSPGYPRGCATSAPLDDYADNGIITNNASSNLLFQDVYIDGFESNGTFGPIGGPITWTRANISFNMQSGMQFDDGSSTADAAGSQLIMSYVTGMGNGCKQEYPIVHAWPALACWDDISGGFGDFISGQNTELDVLSLDHGVILYNTKDAFIGPHTQVQNLTVTNTFSAGNMGAQMKNGATTSSTVLFQNNLFVMNCFRQTAALPGAAQNFNLSTGLGGSYLSDYCRAGGDGWSFLTRAGSTNHYYGNTVVAANATMLDINCGYVDGSGVHEETNCGTSPLVFVDNNFLGYTDPSVGAQPGQYFFDPGAGGSLTLTGSNHNNYYGVRNISPEVCGVNNATCVNPLLTSEPAQAWPGSEAALDVFNAFGGAGNSFYPTGASPLVGAGTTMGGLTTDFYAVTRPSPPTEGAAEPNGSTPTVATPTASPVAGTYSSTQTVTLSTVTGGASIVYTTDGSTPTVTALTCAIAHGTLYSGPLTVSTTQTINAIGCLASDNASSMFSGLYTITPPATTTVSVSGTVKLSGSVTIP